MARRKQSAPRRGSLGVRPRKRASRILPRVRSWPVLDLPAPKPLAFVGYKAGMTHIIIVDNRPGSATYGQEIAIAATVIETPPMIVLGARFYTREGFGGLKTLTEVWVEPPKDLEIWRRISTFSADPRKNELRTKMVLEQVDRIAEVAILAATQPKLVGGLSKKVPDILEVKIGGGSIYDRVNYALSILGKQLDVSSVFSAGQFVDVIGVTKGKGFQGVIKRFGVRELPRWHKHRKGSRRVGARSPTIGALSAVPQAGQMGFHRRTEFNKWIISIGNNGYEVTPSGGFPHYGLVKSTYVVLIGSVFGPPKRPVVLRWPIRPPTEAVLEPPRVVYTSLESKQ
ncbi:MAG: 50S ribosomal protein L3 [Sulfolobales archaeon]|nr:50S ribosomal protein L3 [Sulfolobales archaeon]MCX8208859.1 50S ribosomal protein L3 [Sulfolobales archaeon]MDW8010514.1 50S ribosomal protein L3 [Sulfolobales archaeon]